MKEFVVDFVRNEWMNDGVNNSRMNGWVNNVDKEINYFIERDKIKNIEIDVY